MPEGVGHKCSVEGCQRSHKARGWCASHYAQAKRGVVPTTEINERDRNPPTHCVADGCSAPVKSKGFCRTHYARWRRHGHTNRTHVRGVCSLDGCFEVAIAKKLCRKHYYRNLRTGSTDDPVPHGPLVGHRCMVSNCQNMVSAREMCQMHYMRWQRHGDVLPTRAADWGAREKHPLYGVWANLMRKRRADTCERWTDLWIFVSDIGESRPTMQHLLAKKSAGEKLGPDNFYWAAPRATGNSEEKKAGRAAYMRGWYVANAAKVADGELRSKYGIGLSDYEAMFAVQEGKCDICKCEEARIDHRTKKISRLAVDHDHKTGAVRALLCHSCNVSLGGFGDDPLRLQAGLGYLLRHKPSEGGVH